jgi:hypothetical protein
MPGMTSVEPPQRPDMHPRMRLTKTHLSRGYLVIFVARCWMPRIWRRRREQTDALRRVVV